MSNAKQDRYCGCLKGNEKIHGIDCLLESCMGRVMRNGTFSLKSRGKGGDRKNLYHLFVTQRLLMHGFEWRYP